MEKQQQMSLLNMTIKQFKEYLNKFDDSDNFSMAILDMKKRKNFNYREKYILDDIPMIILDIDGSFEKY